MLPLPISRFLLAKNTERSYLVFWQYPADSLQVCTDKSPHSSLLQTSLYVYLYVHVLIPLALEELQQKLVFNNFLSPLHGNYLS
jgi:hypothetical protein